MHRKRLQIYKKHLENFFTEKILPKKGYFYGLFLAENFENFFLQCNLLTIEMSLSKAIGSVIYRHHV